MAISSTAVSVQLRYTGEAFPGQDWNEFLKNCNATRNHSRYGNWWGVIRGKGFIIWISSFYLHREGSLITWLSDIELSSNVSVIGRQTLEEFIAGALHNFEKMSVIAAHTQTNPPIT
jgi:hypothetical protein